MATALESVTKLTVQSLVRACNQAAVLTVDHSVKQDSAEALPINTEVTYTDDELGFVFRGRVVAVEELWQGGEGIRYTCADSFRTIAKEPALLNNSGKLKIEESTSGKAYLSDLLDEFIANGGPIASYDITDMEDIEVESIDMAGQSLFEWIDRILSVTADTVCWIEYNVSDQPILKFRQYSSQPDLGLAKGAYTVVDPELDDNPLIVDARIGESLDSKYSKLLLEGCGHFKRWDLRYIPPASWEEVGSVGNQYLYRFNVPEEWATGRYLDEEGKCRDDMWARVGLGYTSDTVVIGQLTADIHGLEVKRDESTGQYYWEINLTAGGITSSPPSLPQIQAWFSYTGYEEALVEERTGPLSDEGTFISQHPDLFWFEGASGVDHRSVLSGLADNMYERYLTGADRRGSINVHIKGLDTDVQLGAQITIPAELAAPRVRGVRYDFVRRNMTLDCSDAPLRPEVTESQFKARLQSEIQGNWYTDNDEEEPSCFCGGTVFVDENEGVRANTAGVGGGRGRGPTWDCVFGVCDERDDANGQYQTLADCERDCTVLSWDFVPCTGCVTSENWGQYATEDDCVNDNPDPFAPAYNCGSGGSQSAPASTGEASGRSWGCDGCGCSEVGGEFFIGFIKTIEVDKRGRVVKAECGDCTLTAQSGWTGTVSVVCNIISGSIPTYFGMEFLNGILIAVDDISGYCYSSNWESDKAVLLAASECLG